MKRRVGKVGKSVLLLFALFSIFLFILERGSIHTVKSKYYEEKLKAGQIFEIAQTRIKQERERLGLPIDLINDPNATGLIGSQASIITSERSDLSDALTSTDPNFSAIFVALLKNLKLKPGDTVAIGLDGTFPGANLALYSALRVLNLNPIIIATVSSAMWGANDPLFTWLDIEHICYQDKIFPFKSIGATIGGEDDLGRGLSPQGREEIVKAMSRCGVELITTENFEQNIQKRLEIYLSQGKIKGFINIGKSIANIGSMSRKLPSGIIANKKRVNDNSVIKQMLKQRIPVINISDITIIASRYGLPIAPTPLPILGKGKLYMELRYSQIMALIYSIIIIIILFFVIQYDLEYYLSKKKETK